MNITDRRNNDSHIYLYGLTVLSVLLQSFYQTEVERLNIISSLNSSELLYNNESLFALLVHGRSLDQSISPILRSPVAWITSGLDYHGIVYHDSW